MSKLTASFGQNGPHIPRLGLGLMGLSIAYGPQKPDHERLAILDNAYSMGARFWDTADMYGDSEDLLGRWFKANPAKRDSIFLATKFANRYAPEMKSRIVDSSAIYTKEACARSLSRLKLPSIDLYYCHRLDGKTPIEETVQAMAELKNEGKIKYLGLSECSSRSLRRAHKVHPISAVQVEYSPFALEIESEQIDLLRTCRELGVAVVAYSPLGRGMLTGTLRSPDDFDDSDFRKVAPRFSAENFPRNLILVDQLDAIAKEKHISSTQLVLSWLMAQGDDIFPIPGTTRLERLKENIGSLHVKLSSEEKQRIRELCDRAEICGTRYPESLMAACYADTPPL